MPAGWGAGSDNSFVFSGDLHDSSWGIWWPLYPLILGGAALVVVIHDAAAPAGSPRWRAVKPPGYYGNIGRRLALPLLITVLSGSIANCRLTYAARLPLCDYDAVRDADATRPAQIRPSWPICCTTSRHAQTARAPWSLTLVLHWVRVD